MRVVFLDRDGVINEYPGDFEYVKSWEEFRFLPQAKSALKRLTDQGIKIFTVSNQAGVSKGIYSQEELDRISRNMIKELKDAGADISQALNCIHKQEENCNCRKPKTGMVEQVVLELKKSGHKVILKDSFFVGDSIRDIQAGKAMGLKTILVFTGREKPENSAKWSILPDFTCQDIQEAANIILNKP
ncbi:MAG: HAD family hydrolase [Candidatus Omnitrophica bacterium]|nr:HAD family hydrolase [Candidatus Omnitrophota bacterium]